MLEKYDHLFRLPIRIENFPMKPRENAQLTPRKQPQQTRSTALVEAALAAALQVLAREGAARFTMTRVAVQAGVSVGSLYQYFPNKASILFRLQSDEWRRTNELLRGILEDRQRSPLERLRVLVHAFLQSECEEAAMRVALDDAAPLYRGAPEAREAKASGSRIVQTFLKEALPDAEKNTRHLAGNLLRTTLAQVGKAFSQKPRTQKEIQTYADAMAGMFCAYLGTLGAW